MTMMVLRMIHLQIQNKIHLHLILWEVANLLYLRHPLRQLIIILYNPKQILVYHHHSTL